MQTQQLSNVYDALSANKDTKDRANRRIGQLGGVDLSLGGTGSLHM